MNRLTGPEHFSIPDEVCPWFIEEPIHYIRVFWVTFQAMTNYPVHNSLAQNINRFLAITLTIMYFNRGFQVLSIEWCFPASLVTCNARCLGADTSIASSLIHRPQSGA